MVELAVKTANCHEELEEGTMAKKLVRIHVKNKITHVPNYPVFSTRFLG